MLLVFLGMTGALGVLSGVKGDGSARIKGLVEKKAPTEDPENKPVTTIEKTEIPIYNVKREKSGETTYGEEAKEIRYINHTRKPEKATGKQAESDDATKTEEEFKNNLKILNNIGEKMLQKNKDQKVQKVHIRTEEDAVPRSKAHKLQVPEGSTVKELFEMNVPIEDEANTNMPTKGKAAAPRKAAAAADPAVPPSSESKIKALSNILFKSSIVTKSDTLVKEDAATLIENNNKLKALASQIPILLEQNNNIYKKFIESKDGLEPAEGKPKREDVMKYHVIEVTENTK